MNLLVIIFCIVMRCLLQYLNHRGYKSDKAAAASRYLMVMISIGEFNKLTHVIKLVNEHSIIWNYPKHF